MKHIDFVITAICNILKIQKDNYVETINKRNKTLTSIKKNLNIHITTNKKYIINTFEPNVPFIVISLHNARIYKLENILTGKKVYFDNYPYLDVNEENLRSCFDKCNKPIYNHGSKSYFPKELNIKCECNIFDCVINPNFNILSITQQIISQIPKEIEIDNIQLISGLKLHYKYIEKFKENMINNINNLNRNYISEYKLKDYLLHISNSISSVFYKLTNIETESGIASILYERVDYISLADLCYIQDNN